MRPNRNLIRKLKNTQQFLLLFKILLVFNSIVIIHAGVVRREIGDKLQNNNTDEDNHYNDDIFFNAGVVTSTTIAGTAGTTTTLPSTKLIVTSSSVKSSLPDIVNATFQPQAFVTATTNKDEPSITTTLPSAPIVSVVITDPPPLSIAKITANDIKKPQNSLVQINNTKKLIQTEGDDDDILKAPSDVKIESTTATAIESQQLHVTTFETIIKTEQKQRKGKTIVVDPSVPVTLERNSIAEGTFVTATESNHNNNKEIKAIGESTIDNVSKINNVIRIQKASDNHGNIINSHNVTYQNSSITFNNIAATNIEVSTELPHSSDYNSFNEQTEAFSDQTTTEQSDDSDFITTIDVEKYSEESTQSTVTSESFFSTSHDYLENNEESVSSENFDLTTTKNISNLLKSETDETTIINKLQKIVTTSATIKNNNNRSSNATVIERSQFKSSTNYDTSINEIKNFSSNSGVGNITTTTRRGSKFIKGEANMTIPDAAEVWALASLKNVIDNKNIKEYKNDSNNLGNQTTLENTTNSVKIMKQPIHNETTSTKLLADWSQIMKEVDLVEKGNDSLQSNNVNSVESALENTIKTDSEKGKTHEQLKHESKTTVTFVFDAQNDLSSSSSSSSPLPPTKSTSELHNETVQQTQIVPVTLSSVDEQEKEIEKQEKSEKQSVNKNQNDDDMKKLNLEENSKNSGVTMNKTTLVAAVAAATTEIIQQVTRVMAETTTTTTATTPSSVDQDHFLFTSNNDSSSNKVNSTTDTGAIINKGTSETSSLSLTTEAISSNLNSTPTTVSSLISTTEKTSIENNLEQSSISSTDINLIALTTARTPRTSSATFKPKDKLTTIIPTISTIKIVTKDNIEPEKTDHSIVTGPENSIESNTIDRVSLHTTQSYDQSAQDTKIMPTLSTTTTTTKINKFPVDTNSVEHLGQSSTTTTTTTHKIEISTKTDQEYSIHNVPKFLETTTEFPTSTSDHTTNNPHHLGGSMSDDVNMPEETDYNVIIAISISVVGIIALILLVGFLYVMRKRQKQMTYGQRCRPVSLDAYSLDNVSVYNSVRRKGALRASKRSYGNVAFDDPSLKHNLLNVQELVKFVEKKSSIYEEFKDVPQITARSDEVPAGCEDKNRYANVVPLPETRVFLKRQNDDDKTEYINANYVRGPKDAPNYYIACQAPLENTVVDFWRMIWEQNSRVIIMATDLIENGIEKCAEYLPTSIALDNHFTSGDFQIVLKSREVKEKYAVSVLHLKNTTTNIWREITHFWYQWPESGVPNDEAGVIAMLLEARSCLKASPIDQTDDTKNEDNNGDHKTTAPPTETNGITNGSVEKLVVKSSQKIQGPLTVHCSPGTGRTGTIIACDIVLRSLETPKRSVDIPQIVYYVRRGRASSVQTKEQYEFIYRVANMYASKISGPIIDN